MKFSVSKNNREKYSEIEITWYEVERISSSRFMWWLPDPESFSVGDDEITIPISTSGSDSEDDDDETSIVYHYISPVRISTETMRFPVRNTQTGTKVSMVCIWGEEDNMSISESEFNRAGGSVSLDYDPSTLEHQLVISPPQMNIGVNDQFSVTLEGSVPGAVIAGQGIKFHKRKHKVRTVHFGRVNSVLEVELPYITDKDSLYNAVQRLLEKYSKGTMEYNLEYKGKEIPQLDNNRIVPQTVSVDSYENFQSSDGFQYTNIGDLPEITLGEVSQPDITLSQFQHYLKAYIN